MQVNVLIHQIEAVFHSEDIMSFTAVFRGVNHLLLEFGEFDYASMATMKNFQETQLNSGTPVYMEFRGETHKVCFPSWPINGMLEVLIWT